MDNNFNNDSSNQAPMQGGNDLNRKLFVGSLSWDTTDQTLGDFFAQVGAVESAQVIVDKFSGRSRGFGFVVMATEEDAQKAIADLNGQSLDGRQINVSAAQPPKPREDRGGFRGGDRGGFGGRRDDRGGFGGRRDDRGGDRGPRRNRF